MKIKSTILLAVCFGLAGCAALTPRPIQINKMTPNELKTVSSLYELCSAYQANYHPERWNPIWQKDHPNSSAYLRDEILSRIGANEREMDSIKNRQVYIGMSEKAALCAWPSPTTINTTTTQYGRDRQIVYRWGSSTSYIYTENGIVKAISN